MASCTYNPGIGSVCPYAVLNVTQQSQNIENNTSVVRWELILYRPSAIHSSTSKAFSVSVNGSVVKSGTTTIGGSGTKTIASGTTTVSHNSDGTKSINFSFSLTFEITWSGKWIGTGSASGSMTLSTIPRSSSIDSVSGNTIGSSITVNISRHASFTHQLWYKIGNSPWFDLGTGYTTSCTFTPDLEKCAYITTKTSETLELCIRTFSGSTRIGSDVYNYDYKINVPSSIVPKELTISLSEAVGGIAEKFRAYVKNKSKLSGKLSAIGAYGSTIKSYTTKINGRTYNGSSFTSELLDASGSVPVTVVVTDSRGRTATKTINIIVLDYVSPTVTAFSVVRGDSNDTPNAEGTYALVRLNFSISPVNNLNDKSYKIEYKERNAADWKVLGTWNAYSYNGTWNAGNILNADYSYMMRLTLTDFFGSVQTTYDDIASAFTLIDFNKGGRSIAFGGVSERDPNTEAIDFKMEIFDRFGTRINNGMAKYTGSGSNSIDPDMTIDELILTDTKTPNGKFMYINTVFYADKSLEAPRAQTAIPYNSNGSMYHRYYANGVWSSWRRHVNADEVNKNTILWSGGYYMNDSQAAYLSEAVSLQPNGIVIVWSYYDGSNATDTCFQSFFIPKYLINAKSGCGHSFWLNSGEEQGTISGYKYLFINDTGISGYGRNGEGSSRNFVMRYVIGV